ncbi:MAG: beta-ketoacyl-ACP synthase II [Prosthecobacter sp.]
MSERRVVITGMGAIAPNGNTKEEFWKNLLAGKSGIRRLQSMDTEKYDCKIGGEVVDFNPTSFFNNHKDARRADRYFQFAMAASKMAAKDAGLNPDSLDPHRVGVMVGSGIGGLSTIETQYEILLNKGPNKVSPFLIPMMITNIASGMIAAEFGYMGPNMVIVTACATSNNNIGEAWRMIKFGDADVMIAGGAEASIRPCGLAGFANMRALSLRNDDPERASRPWDKDRDGFVMGEGAGVVVIEELEHAKKRGATIYAELAGYGATADAYHLTSPHPEGLGAAKCMEMALRHAKLNTTDIDYINAHATSTPVGDLCELRAIKRTFGDHATNGLLVSGTKSMTGHLLGAAGGVELVASVYAIRDQVIPPTINVENLDPEVDVDIVPNVARPAKVEAALSNSFGFGGHNAALLVTKFKD